MDRVKGRDLLGSINKCYSLYYQNDKVHQEAADGAASTTAPASNRRTSVKSPRKRSSSEVIRNVIESTTDIDEEDDDVDDDELAADEKRSSGLADWRMLPFGLLNVNNKQPNGLNLVDGEKNSEIVAANCSPVPTTEDNNNCKDGAGGNSEAERKRRLSDGAGGDGYEGTGGNGSDMGQSKKFKGDAIKDMMYQV